MFHQWLKRAVFLCAVGAAACFGPITAEGAIIRALDGSQFWTPWDVRENGTVEITENNPRSGLGSLEIHTYGSSDKAGAKGKFVPTIGTLGELLQDGSQLGFDWYRDSTSTVADHFVPALRLHASTYVLDASGNIAGEASLQIIWERTYNDSSPPATDTWVSESDLQHDKFWVWVNGAGGIFNYQPLDDWFGEYALPGNGDFSVLIDEELTTVEGISVAAGSGWDGEYHGYVDNVTAKFNGEAKYVANFEPVPEPATVVGLLGTGAIGGLLVLRRRHRK